MSKKKLVKLHEAVDRYLKHNQKARRAIQILMVWDAENGIKENSKLLGICEAGAYQYVKRYGLEYKKMRVRAQSDPSIIIRKMVAMRKIGLTLAEIGKVFGISRQAIQYKLKAADSSEKK